MHVKTIAAVLLISILTLPGTAAVADPGSDASIRAGASRLGVRPGTDQPTSRSTGVITPLSGVWVEGPGYDITYGASYEVCARRCLDAQKCVMIEYYRPEKKCNLYSQMRPRLKGGSSVVGIRG